MKRLLLILIVITSLSGYYGWQRQNGDDAAASPQVSGWGAIEADTINLTAEVGGQIIAIHTVEGDEVVEGELLIELDPAILQARQEQLAAALATARAHLAEVSGPPRPEEIAVAEAELAQAQAAREGAQQVWQTAQTIVDNPLELTVRIDALSSQIPVLVERVGAAQAELKKTEIKRDEAYRNQSGDEAVTTYQAAVKQAEAAQGNLAAAEAELVGARSQLDLLAAIRDNPLTLKSQANAANTAYERAEAAVKVAEARLAAVKAGPRAEEIAIAQAQVERAEAALARLAVQLAKLRLTAPLDGVVLEQPAQPGELAAPGATLLQLGDLNEVRLKVFIPEVHIGRVRLGQRAEVSVDAYPGETFIGRVSFIAQEAEFTPQNVQTKEERVNLVFAVEISLDNPDHRLKPGMPARADILVNAPFDQPAEPTLQIESLPTSPPTATARRSATASPKPTPSATLQPASPTPALQAEILAWRLNVRSGPGITYPVVASLRQGDTVTVLEVDSPTGWLRVALPEGETGWVTGKSNYVVIGEQ